MPRDKKCLGLLQLLMLPLSDQANHASDSLTAQIKESREAGATLIFRMATGALNTPGNST